MNRRYRKTVIAGNWKMNMTATETKKFAEDLKKIMPRAKWCDTLICVPACNISTAMKAFKDLRISVGAENVYFEEKGAYTGEISADMLKDLGVKYVIVGHSERRQYFCETDQTVNKKVHAVLNAGMNPIICVGESLEQRETGITTEWITMQIKAGLQNVGEDKIRKMIIEAIPPMLQNAIGGGGRYDKLAEEGGGRPTPGLGFALGFERCVLALEAAGVEFPRAQKCDLFVACVDDSVRARAFMLVQECRDAGFTTEMDHQKRSLKSQFKLADKLGAARVAVLGPDELDAGEVTLRDMATHTEAKVRLEEVVGELGRAIL